MDVGNTPGLSPGTVKPSCSSNVRSPAATGTGCRGAWPGGGDETGVDVHPGGPLVRAEDRSLACGAI